MLLILRVGLLSGALWLAGVSARRLNLSLRRRVGLFSLAVLFLCVPLTLWLQHGLVNVPTLTPGARAGYGAPSPLSSPAWGFVGYAVAAVYLAGVAVGLARFGFGITALFRLKTVSAPSTAQAVLKTVCADRKRRPDLRMSPHCSLPFTTGLWPLNRGMIVLPVAMAMGLDRHTLAAVLRHELQHLRAQDPLIAVLSRLSCAVFWPIPFVHALSAQFEEIQEAEADAAAVAGQPLPVKALYAECLIALAARPGLTRPVAAVCRAVGRGFVAMESRIRLILSERPAGVAELAARRRLCRGVAAMLLLALPVIFVFGVKSDGGGHRMQGAQAPAAADGFGEFAEVVPQRAAGAGSAEISLDRLEQALRNDVPAGMNGNSSDAGEDALNRDEIRLRDGL